MSTRRLGKGFAEIVETSIESSPSFLMIPSNQIKPGRYQPRQQIDEQALEELKASIKDRGIIQPVIVRPISHGVYELVAGERRWRAAQSLGLREVPAVVKSLTDQEALEYSLIENLQRHNLNPIEEAMGYARLMSEFGYSQDQLGERLGKNRSTVANMLRLLKLPNEIQEALRAGKISQGHAKAILAVETIERQLALFQQTVLQELSVRQVEALASTWQPKPKRQRAATDPETRSIEEELRAKLGTKVMVNARKNGGRIVIEYFSSEDLGRLLQLFGVVTSTP